MNQASNSQQIRLTAAVAEFRKALEAIESLGCDLKEGRNKLASEMARIAVETLNRTPT